MNEPNPTHPEKSPKAGSAGRVLLVVLGTVLVIVIIVFKQHLSVKHSGETASAVEAPPAREAASKPAGVLSAQNDLVQGALDKATAANVRLQSDLEKAKGEAADLKAKLIQADAASSQLRAQVEADSSEAAGLRGQIEKAKEDASGLRSELASTQSEKAGLAKELEQAKAQGSELQGRLEKSQAYVASIRPLLARARHLPIRTSYEKVLGSPFELVNGRSSYTLHVNNLSLEPLGVDLTIVNAGHTISQSNTIAGGATLNIERLSAGAKVTIGADTFEAVSLTVP
jgi:hypothetical protein